MLADESTDRSGSARPDKEVKRCSVGATEALLHRTGFEAASAMSRSTVDARGPKPLRAPRLTRAAGMTSSHRFAHGLGLRCRALPLPRVQLAVRR